VKATLAILILVFSLAAACSVDEKENPRFGCDQCPGECVLGFCLEDEEGGAAEGGVSPLDGGDDAAEADGATGDGSAQAAESCDEPGATEFCYEGPAGTATTGRCKAGQRVCQGEVWGSCLGQVTPQAESCNGLDDDCDGDVDEELQLGSCDTGQAGVCGEGTLVCESGIAFCQRSSDAAAETCDGKDNDCDGETDEETGGPCYPDSLEGCTRDGSGGFECLGICAPGTLRCLQGELEPCAGYVGPASEQCSTGGIASDEDCDGEADEDCSCDTGQTQDCYRGPEGTLGVGICRAGSQSCQDGSFGACEGEILPQAESCANEGADDDCDGESDEIAGRGDPCIVSSSGLSQDACSEGRLDCSADSSADGSGGLTCIPRQPKEEECNGEDDDCDGAVDEDFDLGSDENNCGRCGRVCVNNRQCCGGECVDTSTDELNCGQCGRECGNGLTCCQGECVDTNTDPQNCGECGKVCGDMTSGTCCVHGECKNQAVCF
jgi:hypothetical protein